VLTELRNTVRLKAIEKIRAQYSKHTLAMGVTLTRSALSGGNQFLLDTELEDDRFSVHFDGLKKWTVARIWATFTIFQCFFTKADKSSSPSGSFWRRLVCSSPESKAGLQPVASSITEATVGPRSSA
jgi:hypothetical protein